MGRPRELVVEYLEQEPADGAGVLALAVAGAAEASVSSPLRIGLSMPALGSARVELWRTELPIERGTEGPITWSSAGDLLVGAIVVCAGGPVAMRATEAYRTIVPFVQKAGFPHIVRMWNQFPRLLLHEDGLERYQSFCAGRAAGFEAEGFKLDGDLPAASAVGAEGEGLVVTFLASRRRPAYVENPRQVSAFHYPRQYGPRSPSFARASRVDLESATLIFVSGTASIVGHESLHRGDAGAQVDETIENLRCVYGAAVGREIASLADVRGVLYRVYVKCAAQLETIQSRLLPQLAADASCLWLRGDICRDELLVEVEMIGRE